MRGSTRGTKRDYIPCGERDLDKRMKTGGSTENGLSGRTEATQRGANYRRYITNGKPDPMKKYQGPGYFEDM